MRCESEEIILLTNGATSRCRRQRGPTMAGSLFLSAGPPVAAAGPESLYRAVLDHLRIGEQVGRGVALVRSDR